MIVNFAISIAHLALASYGNLFC